MSSYLSSEYYSNRIKQARKKMAPDSAMVLFSSGKKERNSGVHYSYRTNSDILYLTGINTPEFAIYIDSKEGTHIFLSESNAEKTRWEGRGVTFENISKNINIDIEKNIHPYEKIWAKLKELLKNKETVYFSLGKDGQIDVKITETINNIKNNLKKGDFAPTRIIHPQEILHEMRIIKTPEEIKLMKKAAEISAKAHENLIKYCRENVNKKELFEFELKSYIEWEFSKNALTSLAYPSIIAAGNNATVLHYTNLTSKVSAQDLVLVDAGCEYEGYASDISRTFPAGGKFTEAQKILYEIVLTAQKKAFEKCYINNTLDGIHDAALNTIVDGLFELGFFKKFLFIKNEKTEMKSSSSKEEIIKKEYYKTYYMHNTSHYLGLDVHDAGSRYINHKPRPLENGMVFTIEPGIYMPHEYDFLPEEFRGIGIRIEDDVIMQNGKHEIITHEAPKEISDLEV
ncbi:MAG: aminopeptidase P N-terminal domain-containing protein [Spirochaetia bacterium]|nr:aminopeptidase P N-terminal domain-containing protein [Spirochaetia bacterium]